MPAAPTIHEIAQSQADVARHYATLPLGQAESLGGKLLYTANLTPHTSLIRAANIAGAASLAATADPEAARTAMREGVIDFLVTTLDEALRILKNEIRKHQPVSVAITQDPEAITGQMKDRGVQPDLLPTDLQEPPVSRYLFWTSTRAALPALDTQVRASIPLDPTRERWLKLSPRYLGRPAQSLHGILLDPAEATATLESLKSRLTDPETQIGVL